MITPFFRGVLALLCLSCLASYVQSEDNSGQQTLDDDDVDGFYRHIRQFYRFGRAFSPFWDSDDDTLARKNHLLHWPGYPISPVVDSDAFSRNNREFYRFGRSYPPYQDKRFLRFGRSTQTGNEDYPRVLLLQSDNSLYRKRRSAMPNSQSDALNLLTSDSNHQSKSEKVTAVGKDLQKRATTPEETKDSDRLSYNIDVNGDKDLEKRFMRFGKRFMRFGRGDEEDEGVDKRFMRFGKSLDDSQDNEKRFMRFGKSLADDQDYEKRFMRFGKSLDDDQDYEKRFMRFGKSLDDSQDNEKRFMRFGKSLADNQDYEKRFMRFGKRFMRFGRGYEEPENEDKRFMRFGKSSDSDEEFDKRFMRFGKRFMRFGRGYEDNEKDSDNVDKSVEDKRFMRFGKRSKRESDVELSSNSESSAAS